MRESRGRTRHTLGREHENPRIVQRSEAYWGKGKVDSPALVGMTLKVQGEETHMPPGYRVVGTHLGAPQKRTRKS